MTINVSYLGAGSTKTANGVQFTTNLNTVNQGEWIVILYSGDYTPSNNNHTLANNCCYYDASTGYTYPFHAMPTVGNTGNIVSTIALIKMPVTYASGDYLFVGSATGAQSMAVTVYKVTGIDYTVSSVTGTSSGSTQVYASQSKGGCLLYVTAGTLTSFDLYLNRFGTISGSCAVTLRDPGTGALLATMLTIADVSTIPTTPTKYTCNASSYTFNQSQAVYVLVEYSGGFAGNSVRFETTAYQLGFPVATYTNNYGQVVNSTPIIEGITGVSILSPWDKIATGTGSSASPLSAATATLSQADEIVFGGVGTEGDVTDTAGTWTTGTSYVSGNEYRDGTTGGGATGNITISAAAEIVSATTAQYAAKTGITSRDWTAFVHTFRGATSSAVTLTVNDAYCDNQVDAVTTTTQSQLAVNDAFCTSQVDIFSVSTQTSVIVNDAYVDTQVDIVTPSVLKTLTVSDAYCESQVDTFSITRIASTTLTVASAYCDIVLDIPAVTKQTSLTVSDAYSDSQVDVVLITKQSTLVVTDAYAETQVDIPVVTKTTTITVSTTYSETQVDAISVTKLSNLPVVSTNVTTQVDVLSLTQVHNLSVNDSFVTTQTDIVSTTKSDTLVVNDLYSESQVDNATINLGVIALSVQSSFSTTQTDIPAITKQSTLMVAQSFVETQTDVIGSLTGSVTLVVADGYSESQVDTLSIVKISSLVVSNVYSTSQTDNVGLSKSDTLLIADTSCETQTDTFVLTQAHNLVTQDGFVTVQSDIVGITKTYNLAVQNGFSLSQVDSFVLSQNHNLIISDGYCEVQADETLIISVGNTKLGPLTDSYDGLWTNQDGNNTNLYDSVNETSPSDSDYIQSEWSPNSSSVVLKLTPASDPNVSYGHIFRYRYDKEPDSGEAVNLTVQLRQDYIDENTLGTLIVEWIHTDISGTLSTVEQTLTAEQANSISDYSNLFVRMVAT